MSRRSLHRRVATNKAGAVPPGFTESVTTVTITHPLLRTTQTETQTFVVPVAPTLPVPALPGHTTSSSSASSASSAPSSLSSTSSASGTSTSSSAPPSSSSSPPPSSPLPSSSPPATPTLTPQVSTIYSTASVTPTTQSGASTTSASTKGLSGGAIAGIVAAAIIVSLAFLLFAIRKVFLRRRSRNRRTIIYPSPDFSSYPEKDRNDDPLPIAPRPPASPAPRPPRSPAPRPPRSPAPYALPPPPPMSYNNLPPPSSPVRAHTPGAHAHAVPMTRHAAQPHAAYATVRCAFIPSLPDELSITTGERVRLVSEYDDGWALCANARGEQGVVPVECLERPGAMGGNGQMMGGAGYLGQGSGDWRMSRRESSLGAGQGLRY